MEKGESYRTVGAAVHGTGDDHMTVSVEFEMNDSKNHHQALRAQ